MLFRTIAIAAALTFAAATAGPTLVSSAAFAKDKSHSSQSDHKDHKGDHKDNKGDHKDHKDHKGDRKHN
jgi:hypothetical protein